MGGISLFQLFGSIAIKGMDKTTRALQDVSNEGQDTQKKLNVSFQDIGKKAGQLGKKMAKGIAGAATALIAGAGATREFRQDWGKLQTTFQTTGSSAETAKNVFKDFYGLLGEDDTSIEASNHLAQMTNDQKSLSEWTNACTGIYAKFGDSLPLEGLTEAANETMRVGQVTGPLADALNWASMSNEQWNKTLGEGTAAQKAFSDAKAEGLSNEDAFNAALATTNSEAEREALLRNSLNGIYGESATTFKEMNGDIIDSNKAQADLSLQLNEVMNKVEPLITRGKIFLAEVLQKAAPYITFFIDNIKIFAPLILGFMGALFALQIAAKIQALMPVIKKLNATMRANPIGIIITIIGLLVAAFIYLWNNCEGFRNFWKNLWEGIKIVVSAVVAAIKVIFEGLKTFFTTVFNIYKTIFTTIWNAIKTAVTTVVNAIKTVITTVFNAIKTFITDVVNGWKLIITTVWNSIKTSVTTIVSGIKAVITSVFNAIKSVVSSIWNGIKNVISGVVNGIKNTIVNVFTTIKTKISSIFNGIKSIITSIWNGIINIIKMPINAVIGLINGFIKGLNKIKIPDWVPGVGGKGINISLIPKLAEGGILEKGQMGFLEGDGAEAVVPLHNNKKWISAVAEDMKLAVGSNKTDEKLDTLIKLLSSYLPDINNKQVVLSTGEVVGALASPMDKALGELANKKGRGR